MPIDQIENEELGLEVRGKLNDLIDAHNEGGGGLDEVLRLKMGSVGETLQATGTYTTISSTHIYYYGRFGAWKPAFNAGDSALWNAGTGTFTPDETARYLITLPPSYTDTFDRIINGADTIDALESGLGLKIGSAFLNLIPLGLFTVAPDSRTGYLMPATTFAVTLTAGVAVKIGLRILMTSSHAQAPNPVCHRMSSTGNNSGEGDLISIFKVS